MWYEKDQNILIWLNSTLSEDLIPFTFGVTSSRELWVALEQRFGGVSVAHIHQLRSRLHSAQKGDLTILEYIQHIKTISDSLMAAGAPVSESDLIVVTLNGLSDDYESFIDSIMLRISSTSLDELHCLLINKELFLTSKKKLVASSVSEPFQAYAAQYSSSQPLLLPTPQGYSAHNPRSNNYSGRGNYRGNNYRANNYRGTNRGNYMGTSHHANRNSGGFNRNSGGHSSGSHSGPKMPCQIYHSTDHEALDCFERMNHAFGGKIPHAKLAVMCAHTNSKSSAHTWLMDSGATSHITNDLSVIQSPVPYNGQDKVYIGDGQGMQIHHNGTTVLNTPASHFRLNNVLHVPAMKHNLLSAYQFLKDNHWKLTLDSDGSKIKDRISGKMLFRGPVHHGFYPFQGTPTASISHSAIVSIKASLQIWHNRLGHPSSAIFKKTLHNNSLVHSDKQFTSFFCSDCAIGKNHKLPFTTSTSSASVALTLVHYDVWGPAPTSSVNGYRYYVLFVDDFTKYNWLFPLKLKSEVYSIFVHFKAYVENLIGNKIKVLRTDSRGEFTSSMFKSFMLQHGIMHQFSCPHTAEQNGCVERKHMNLTETARTLLTASKVPHKFWVEAFSTALYLINRLPISGIAKSPWELLFHKAPDYSKLKVFGCSCYPWLKPYTQSKFDGKSIHCVFLGYSLQQKGYRCLDPSATRVYISRHVLFNEVHFPFHDLKLPTVQPSQPPPTSLPSFTLPFSMPSFSLPSSSQQASSPIAPLTTSSVPTSSPIIPTPTSPLPQPPSLSPSSSTFPPLP